MTQRGLAFPFQKGPQGYFKMVEGDEYISSIMNMIFNTEPGDIPFKDIGFAGSRLIFADSAGMIPRILSSSIGRVRDDIVVKMIKTEKIGSALIPEIEYYNKLTGGIGSVKLDSPKSSEIK